MKSEGQSQRRSVAVLAATAGASPTDYSTARHDVQQQQHQQQQPQQAPALGLIDRILMQAKNGLFGVLYVMSKNTHHSESWTFATFVTEFLHLLAFTFSQEAKFPWDPTISSILQLARYARFDLINFFGGHNNLVWFIFASIIVSGILIMTIHVSLAFTRNKIGSILPLRILREVVGTLFSFLFIPFLSTFAQMSYCHSHQFQTLGIPCQSFAQYAIATFSITLGIVMFCFATLFGACFYNCDPIRHDADSRPHARFEVIYQVVVAIVAVIFNMQDVSNPSSHLGLALLFFIGSLVLTGSVIFFLPYYRIKFVYLRAALCAVWLWCNLCLIIAVIADEPVSHSFSTLLFIGMPMIGLLAILTTKARISSLQNSPPSLLRSAFEVEIKARLHMIQHDLLYRTKTEILDEKLETERQSQLNYIKDQIYLSSMHRFPTSSILRIFAAHFFAYHMDNQQMALVLFESAVKRSPRLDELFRIYRHRMLSIERRDVNDGNVLAGIDYEQTSLQALAAIRATLFAQKAFWSVLLEQIPDLSRLQAFGSHISRHINTADSKCRHLLSLDPDAPEALRMYGLFLQHALNDPEGESLQQRANQIEEHGRKMGSPSLASLKYIPVFKIGLHSGNIVQVNRAACKLVGKTALQLEGFSVNAVLPPVIAANHDHLMKKFAQEGHAQSIITLERELFFQHSRGHIVIVQATLRNCPEAGPEPTILASVCSDPVLNDPSHHHLLIEMPSTKIVNYTENALDWLRVPKHARLTQQLFLSEYVKDIDSDHLEDFMGDPDGVPLSIRFEEPRSCTIQVRVFIRRLLTAPYAMVRFRIIHESISASHDVNNRGAAGPNVGHVQVAFRRSSSFADLPAATVGTVKTINIKSEIGKSNNSDSVDSSNCRNPNNAGYDSGRRSPEPSGTNEEQDMSSMTTALHQLDEDHSMIMGIRYKLMHRASKMDRGVILLGAVLLSAMLAILALTISNQAYVTTQIDVNRRNLDLIQNSAFQHHDLALVLFRLQALRFEAERSHQSGANATWVADAYEKISQIRYRLSDLYMSRTSLDDPIAVAFYQTNVRLNLSSTLSHSLPYGDVLYSIVDAAQSALGRLLVSDQRLKRDAYLIDTYGPNTARAILAEISDLLVSAAHNQIRVYLSWNNIYLIFSLTLIAALFLFAFIPTISHFERENNVIGSIFLSIPRHAVEGLRQATIRSLQIWKDSSDEDLLFDADLNDSQQQDLNESTNVSADDSDEMSIYKAGSIEAIHDTATRFDEPVNDGGQIRAETSQSSRPIPLRKPRRSRQLSLNLLTKKSMMKAHTFLGRFKVYMISKRRYIWLLAQLGFLLAVWAIYTIASYVQDRHQLQQQVAMSNEMLVLAMIPAQVQVFLYFGSRAAAAKAQAQPDDVLGWVGRASDAISTVETMFQAALYSGSIHMNESDIVFPAVTYQLNGMVGRYGPRDSLLFEDACVFLSPHDVRDRCYKFAINTTTPFLYQTGLANSLSSMIGLAYNIRDQLPTSSPDELLRSPHLITIDTMMSDIMGRLLRLNSNMILDENEARQQAYRDSRRLNLILLVLFLFGLAVFLYWPMMKRLDQSNKCTRSMILMVPAQILSNIPEIRDKLRSI